MGAFNEHFYCGIQIFIFYMYINAPLHIAHVLQNQQDVFHTDYTYKVLVALP